jgi:hypothetical protein
MKLSKYLEQLQEFVKRHPEAKDYEVIYARDDEGNGYDTVYFGPTAGVFADDGEFYQKDNYLEYNEDETEEGYKKAENSVCIN